MYLFIYLHQSNYVYVDLFTYPEGRCRKQVAGRGEHPTQVSSHSGGLFIWKGGSEQLSGARRFDTSVHLVTWFVM